MYLGKIVEVADRCTLFAKLHYPHTRTRLLAAPVPHPTAKRQHIILEGDVPSPIRLILYEPEITCERFQTRLIGLSLID
jgi:ABC-type oligopeptide transport system ATPase subunit